MNTIPDFDKRSFYGCRVMITGVLRHCPIEHINFIKDIAKKANLSMDFSKMDNIPYSKIKTFNKDRDKTSSLLGTQWAVTNNTNEPFIVQYGQFDNTFELSFCLNNLINHRDIQLFFDEYETRYDINFSNFIMN